MTPRISIVILSYRDPALLRLCLRSLRDALQGHQDYEVVVVDNATTPETRNVCAHEFTDAFPSLRLIPISENVGFTRGVNEGFRNARGRFLLALNYDIVAHPETIHALADYLQAHPKTGLVGPRLLNFDGTPQESCYRFYRPLTIATRRMPGLPFAARENTRFTMHPMDRTRTQNVDWLLGAAFMTSREAIERVGLMDERLFHYFSDVDWARRFWENGLTVTYVPSVFLYHYFGRSSKGRFGVLEPLFNRTARWHIADAWRYFRKNGIRAHRPIPA